MSDQVIQVKYEELAGVAQRLSRSAQSTMQLRNQVTRAAKALEQGGWQGRGATAFFAEMNGVVYPGFQRLIGVLEEARAVTVQASEIMRRAEDDAARLFKGQAANGNGRPGRGQADEGSWWDEWGEWVHGGLDVVGFIPVVGEIADGINAAVYLVEGRHVEAAISAAAMIPVVGDVGKVGKFGVKVGKEILEETVEGAAKRTLHESVELVGERGALNTYGDALRKVLGRGIDSHPEEWKSLLSRVKEMGVEYVERPGTLAYEPAFGKPGRLLLDPDASIGALRHEFRHALDDAALGHPGFRIMADSEAFWKLEFRGYMEEIKLAREVKAWDAAREIVKEMRARRKEIMGW